MSSDRASPARWKVWTAVVLCAAILSVAIAIASVPSLNRAATGTLWRAKLWVSYTLIPKMQWTQMLRPRSQLLPPDRLSARRHLLAALDKAQQGSDFPQAAFLNSILAQEAFQRAYRTLKAWEKLRDPGTGLVPRGTGFGRAFWNASDTASDLFPFLLLGSQYLDGGSEQLWLGVLAKEREICGPMPCTISFRPTRVIPEDGPTAIFGAAEYAKDGLLPVVERSGRGPWFVRLEEIAEHIIGASQVETRFGKIPSSNIEVNGVMLQFLTRLYWATKKTAYLEMAERIGEAYLFEILPNHDYLPPRDWQRDKGDGDLKNRYLRLRDHGNEIIPGLAELYFLEKMQGRPQAGSYRAPLKRFLDTVLEVGRTPDGLWYAMIDPKTRRAVDSRIVDTWGYVLNAYQTFDLAEGTSIYADEIRRTMRAVATRKSFKWEGSSHDGYADAIESMLYLLPWFDLQECRRWVDDEIEVMFHMQLPTGIVSGGYLDGNFIRTALLYATYKTQGATVYPWREDVYVGAAMDRNTKDLYIHLSAAAPWRGALKLDLPRHRTVWGLPVEYPRLNGTPEWFVVEAQKLYVVQNLKTGERSLTRGQTLAKGLEIELGETDAPLSLKVSER